VDDHSENRQPLEAESDEPVLRSPVRPMRPLETEPPELPILDSDDDDTPTNPENPLQALDQLRERMERVAAEYADGKLNRAQFNAIYAKLSEQRAIIEKLRQRDPNSPAWKTVVENVNTRFLREHFQARLLYFLVYQHGKPTPLMMGGTQQPNMERIAQVLQQLWSMKSRPRSGLARKDMGNGQWLVLAVGEFSLTIALYMLEPSVQQMNLVRDLQADFERANSASLHQGTRSLDRFVFPQRALTEQ
jgi:hypothetical protein